MKHFYMMSMMQIEKKPEKQEKKLVLDAFLMDTETGTYPKFMGRVEDQEKRKK